MLHMSHFLSNGLLPKNMVATVSSAFIGKGFSLSILKPRLLAGAMPLKNVYQSDFRPSFFYSVSPLVVPREAEIADWRPFID